MFLRITLLEQKEFWAMKVRSIICLCNVLWSSEHFVKFKNLYFLGVLPYVKIYLYCTDLYFINFVEARNTLMVSKKYIVTTLVELLPLHMEMFVTTISSHGTAIFSSLLSYIVYVLLSLSHKKVHYFTKHWDWN